jgi:hypothetical protein
MKSLVIHEQGNPLCSVILIQGIDSKKIFQEEKIALLVKTLRERFFFFFW